MERGVERVVESFVEGVLVTLFFKNIKAHSYPGRVFPYNQRTTLIQECYVYLSFIEVVYPQLQLSHCELKLNYYIITKYIRICLQKFAPGLNKVI